MRTDARRATIIAYRNRVIGNVKLADGKELIGQGKILYEGNFPFMAIANSLQLPREATYTEHANCWHRVYRKFDEVWNEYEMLSSDDQQKLSDELSIPAGDMRQITGDQLNRIKGNA